MASMQKGQPTGAGQPQAAGESGQPAGGDQMARAQGAPEEVKQKVVQMHASRSITTRHHAIHPTTTGAR